MGCEVISSCRNRETWLCVKLRTRLEAPMTRKVRKSFMSVMGGRLTANPMGLYMLGKQRRTPTSRNDAGFREGHEDLIDDPHRRNNWVLRFKPFRSVHQKSRAGRERATIGKPGNRADVVCYTVLIRRSSRAY